jgi:hypothetical protein
MRIAKPQPASQAHPTPIGGKDGGRHRPNVYGIPRCSRPVRGCESGFYMRMSAGEVPRPPVFGENIWEGEAPLPYHCFGTKPSGGGIS